MVEVMREWQLDAVYGLITAKVLPMSNSNHMQGNISIVSLFYGVFVKNSKGVRQHIMSIRA